MNKQTIVGRTRLERETTITFNELEPMAWIGSASPVMKRKLAKMNLEMRRDDGEWKNYNIPKTWIKISPPRKVSEKQRKMASERFLKMHSLRQKPIST